MRGKQGGQPRAIACFHWDHLGDVKQGGLGAITSPWGSAGAAPGRDLAAHGVQPGPACMEGHQERCPPAPQRLRPAGGFSPFLVRSGSVLSRVRKPLRKLFLLGRWGPSLAQSWPAPVSLRRRQRYEQGELETSPSSWRGALDLLAVSA